ncbi:MAG: hypothetical protein A2600_11740 [Candidatus Lambdaproteobacteria bacterium RIFOXYD1_FULL_56_27]|uniref:Lcl C-terminal domain-containing protein n=1 Tax=Candidatus Lambdaproteobacteria bacterium RIFOXYD2_FULL_56_26 TaxID=1817773 RepID=A0A1F6GXJ2_9PROT|nr:MAG: hypothetical protein A2426_12075 [Candidatus Lambdaproteobacteria bacterium RIFOXYC1_FULL_56_13]OGH02774.1 MAG: hypothetical protein A2557_02860 [Candidatus Lambdaproteobacteria bacterium RIFOXYD2_FULL_56_26]OGH08016.1 MAG: hypothetical protein A2600_11740 [Candidatus Lambdaproteobacteria bacterium RIFOXYD1_FULL_56_27]
MNERLLDHFNKQKIRFVINQDQTVTDVTTGLTWDRTEAGLMAWDQAMDYAQGLSRAGATDWRLPTRQELATLIDLSWKSGPLIDKRFFPQGEANRYWTSTSKPGSTTAWYVSFDQGRVGRRTKTKYALVRCVRSEPVE